MTAPTAVCVHGNATPEEIAAVLAVVRRATPRTVANPYEQWRRGRLEAVRRGRPAP